MMNLAFSHEPGTAISCLSIPITLHKEGGPGVPDTELKCGFKIGGGIDQDYRKSPQVWYFSIWDFPREGFLGPPPPVVVRKKMTLF